MKYADILQEREDSYKSMTILLKRLLHRITALEKEVFGEDRAQNKN